MRQVEDERVLRRLLYSAKKRRSKVDRQLRFLSQPAAGWRFAYAAVQENSKFSGLHARDLNQRERLESAPDPDPSLLFCPGVSADQKAGRTNKIDVPALSANLHPRFKSGRRLQSKSFRVSDYGNTTIGSVFASAAFWPEVLAPGPKNLHPSASSEIRLRTVLYAEGWAIVVESVTHAPSNHHRGKVIKPQSRVVFVLAWWDSVAHRVTGHETCIRRCR